MNDDQEKRYVQNVMNRSLSGLRGNPYLIHKMFDEDRGENQIVKKKISIGLVFVLAMLLVTLTALAVGLLYSAPYEAKRLANQTLEKQYGITPDMMTVLAVTASEDDTVFTYQCVERLYADQVGVYTVTIANGKASAVWSHDGEDTSGGIAAGAWGAEQLKLLCSDQYGEIMAALEETSPSTDPLIIGEPMTVEEAQANMDRQQAEWEQSKAQVVSAAAISLEEAYRLAVDAAKQEYGLTAAQCDKFVFSDELYDTSYSMDNGIPLYTLSLRLTQNNGAYTEKDGIYVVTVNMDSGIIEDMIYDSGLASNG